MRTHHRVHRRSPRAWLHAAFALQLTLGAAPGVRAQPAAARAADQAAAAEAQVRSLIRTGQHEAAIEAARAAKAAAESGPADALRLSRAYLLLILSYVNYGNFQANEQRAMAAETLHKEARTLIRELLSEPALRRTELDRTSGEFPPEMIEMFDRTRAELFGALRIITLRPADARVVLDGVPLELLPGESHLGDARLPTGPHAIVVERPGYHTLRETITITPNSWQERPYALAKKRGKKFYAVLGAGAAAVVGGVTALVAGGGAGGSTAAAPLPGPPPPPAR